MPQRVSIDDSDEQHVSYKGVWEMVLGSSRQWEMTIHSTLTPGSTATFNFKGYQVWVWGTIPPGVGSNLIEVSIDGGAATTVSRTSNGSAVYNEVYFSSDLLRNGYHQIVVTGLGSADKGNSEFQLDRFEFQTDDEIPSFTTSGISTSTSSSGTSGPTSDSSSSGTTDIASSPKKSTPAGAIAGAVVGALALIALVLGFLLWRRRRRSNGDGPVTKRNDNARNPFAPDPFPLENKPPSHIVPNAALSVAVSTGSHGSAQTQEHISEKSTTYQSSHPESSLYSPMSTAGSSQALVPVRMNSSSTLATPSSNNVSRSPLSPNDGSAIHSSPTARSPESFVPLQTMTELPTPANDNFEHPPPSYTHHDEGVSGTGSVLSYK
ncbi:hypothetical protein JR316_0007658 [Psilocybe cubensis]|uniref:Uncharacterized protein n=2 Tax=Psilocybe cubensis TaxID=181762 RepID=A0A8H7XUY0_PSICU|nr:hypothetical protein JR316_0007658 [Psilocybe cubensis]KAH9479079.1 hypothetical protein JR316_0007658 [Psilocybe cubensis]